MSESKSGWSELDAGIKRPAGDRHTLQVEQAIAHVVTIAAPAFEATSAVLLPDAPRPRRLEDGVTTGLSLVAQAMQHAIDHRDHKLTVAGHSQGFGNTRGEISLSSRRAGNLLCYLRGERERWIAACACHTERDLRRISAWANGTSRATLDPKQFGRAAWGAVFDLYDRHVAALLGKKDLSEARAALSFEDPPMVACGAFWPYGGGSRRIDPNQHSAMPVTATASRDSRVDLLFRQPGPELPEQPEDQAPGTRFYMTARYVCRKPIDAPLTPAAACVRLSGMYFDTNKCFLLDDALPGLERLVALQAQNPGSPVLVVGHTDTSGDPAYNDTLSLERAQAVVAYLRDDVEAWLAWYDDSKPVKKRWGAVEDERMFRRVRDGQALSKEAIRAYQRDRELDDDGVIGPKTRRALIGDYMAVDGTSLPTDAQTTAHGCGESFPVVDAGDGVDEQQNRRVELFVFPKAIEPAPAGDISKAGSTEYAQWCVRLVETIEIGTIGALREFDVVLLDGNGEKMPNAYFEVVADGVVVHEGQADGDGLAAGMAPVDRDVVTLAWSTGPVRPYYYRREYAIELPDDATQAQLANLGFDAGPALEDDVRAFERCLGVTESGQMFAIGQLASDWYASAAQPAAPEPASESSLEFPAFLFAENDCCSLEQDQETA